MDSNKVYLTQTDTTVGFLSSDDKKLSKIKQRDPRQKILQVVDSFQTLKTKTRVPCKYKKIVRRAKKTTFIYKNGLSFRVVDKNSKHYSFINKVKIMFSTSANLTKQKFDESFAIKNSDLIVYNFPYFKETTGSNIYKLNNKKIKRIR